MSSVPRVFIPDDAINDGIAVLSGGDFRRITRVLRLKTGDKIKVCDMRRREYDAEIIEISEKGAALRLGAPSAVNTEPPYRAVLYQALPKGDKMDFIIQKAVELGVSEIVPVLSERCVSRPEESRFPKKLERYKKIVSGAAAQSGRSFLPEISGLTGFPEACAEIKNFPLGFICYEGEGTVPLRKLVRPAERIAFFIGPEGGLSCGETALAAEYGIPLAGLGPRILRAESAGFFVLSALSVLLEG